MHGWLAELGLILTAIAAAYALLAALATLIATARSRRAAPDTGAARPAVTILKPLCGSEPELYERLCSVCTQDYPQFQVIFGLHGPADTALPVARRVQQQFSALDIDCVIDPTRHGVNAKVSNLLNMLPLAKHDLLIITDSDIEVPPDYLKRVLTPLSDPRVGLVTCGYAGRAGPGLWSALGAQFINAWFMPSVYFAAMFGSQWFVSGSTIALRRELLARGGGLKALADQLADDFQLGAQVRALRLRVVLSDVRVDTLVDEPSLAALCRHSLRWLRTIRAVRLWAYTGCSITFSLPLAGLGAALAGFQPKALILLAITVAARLVLHFAGQRDRWRDGWRQLGLIPLHDALLLALWIWGFSGREVSWRQERFGVGRDGSLHRVP
jgi:ceramide glucosyltransferase